MKPESKDDFYARNAREGRTVRLSMKLDMQRLTEAEREASGLRLGEIEIHQGTCTPLAAAKILHLLDGVSRTADPLEAAIAELEKVELDRLKDPEIHRSWRMSCHSVLGALAELRQKLGLRARSE